MESELRRVGVRGQPAPQQPHLVDLVGRDMGSQLHPAGPAHRPRRPGLELVEVTRRAPVDQPALDDPEGVVGRAGRVRGEHQTRPHVGGLEHAAQLVQHHAEPAAPAPQGGGPLVVLIGRGRAHLRVDMVEQRAARIGITEQPQHGVEAAPVEVGVQIAQARGQAAAHLPVGRGVLAARQPAPTVAQAEQGVELLDELEASRRPCNGPIVTAWPAAGSEATSRIGNGMSSRQRM